MSDEERFVYVIDNEEPTFYDLKEHDILDMNSTEDMLNALHEENELLKAELNHIRYRFMEYRTKVNKK